MSRDVWIALAVHVVIAVIACVIWDAGLRWERDRKKDEA
jgi:hypothetical protein